MKVNIGKLCNEDYRLMVTVPIFGQGMGQYAGTLQHPTTLAAAGILAVATWWCEVKAPLCSSGENDLLDAAYEAGTEAALQIGFERDDVVTAGKSIRRKILELECGMPLPRSRDFIFPRSFRKPAPRTVPPLRERSA